MQTVAIPRGQVALAAGHAKPNDTKLVLTAGRGQTDYGICSNNFLELAFRTDSYRIEVDFNGDGSWSYVQDTMLMVKGRDPIGKTGKVSRARPGSVSVLKKCALGGGAAALKGKGIAYEYFPNNNLATPAKAGVQFSHGCRLSWAWRGCI